MRKTVPEATRAALGAWMRHRGDDPGPLFTGLRRGERSRGLTGGQISRLPPKYGLGHAHGLRHASATKLAREGHSLFELQAHLGHANAQTAGHYVDRVDDKQGKMAEYLAAQLDEYYDAEHGNRRDPTDGQ